MEQHAQKGGGRHLVRLVSPRNGELYQCAIPCVEFADEETVPYSGELSYVFDFAESLLPRLMARLNRSLKDELSLMAFVNTFDEEWACFPWDEIIVRRSTSEILSGCRGAKEDTTGVACTHANRNS